MYGKYPHWRGQQVASGRFGVTSEMINSSYLVEIKIGQGAKPGEGGHLPAQKVTEKVAQARNATAGTDLISPVQQPRPLLDRGPGRADRRAEDREPRRARVGEGAGGAEHRHDRRRHRQGGRRHHHAVGLRGRHRRGALARAAARGPALRHRHARGAPRADRGGHPQPRGDLGRRRLPPRPRHREAALPGRQPRGLRHARDGLARLHDLPRLPARHLPRGHRHPDRVRGGGRSSRASRSSRRRSFEPAAESCARFFAGMGEEVGELTRRARLRARAGPGRPHRPARAGARARPLDLQRADPPARARCSTSSRSTCPRRPRRARGRRPDRGEPDRSACAPAAASPALARAAWPWRSRPP